MATKIKVFDIGKHEGGVWTLHKAQYLSQQEKPYLAPLDYLTYVCTSNGIGSSAGTVVPAFSMGLPTEEAHLRAYEKFKSKTGERAEIMTSLAERKSTQEMVVKRSLQLWRFARSLRRFDFAGAGRELGIKPTYTTRRRNPLTGEPYYRPNRLRRKAESFAGNFLEYSFGWAPLVGDITSAVSVLANGIPPMRIHASGLQPWSRFVDMSYQWDKKTITSSGWTRVIYGGYLSVENPDLWLANQLGLVNPVATAWELVPFSFLVDHFTSIGTYLSSASDFAGVSISRSFIGTRASYETTSISQGTAPWFPWGPYVDKVGSESYLRTPAPIPGPPLTLRPVTGLSLNRGATYISLLLQQLKGHR